MNICINPTPQPKPDRLMEVSGSDGKDENRQIFQNVSSCLHPGVTFEATVWTAYVTLWETAI
jgi:hypothetical protein